MAIISLAIFERIPLDYIYQRLKAQIAEGTDAEGINLCIKIHNARN